MKLRVKGLIEFQTIALRDAFIAEMIAFRGSRQVSVFTVGPAEGEVNPVAYLDVAFEQTQRTDQLFENIRTRSRTGIVSIRVSIHNCRLDPGEENLEGTDSQCRTVNFG